MCVVFHFRKEYLLIFLCIFVEIITFKIEFTVKKYDIDELNLLFKIIFFLYIERIIFKNPIYSHHLLSIIICLLLLIFVLIQYSLSLLIILYILLGEYCYAFFFLLLKYINTTYFINIYLLASIIGILNICIQLPSFIKSSDVTFQSIYLFYILISIIYYYCHFTIIKNLGPIHSAIIDTISFCIFKLYSINSLPYKDIIYLFLCLFSLLIY